jgi:adenylate cyclase
MFLKLSQSLFFAFWLFYGLNIQSGCYLCRIKETEMAVEIERKFLVKSDFVPNGESQIEIVQGYLCADPQRTVRVRLAGKKAFLTIKGKIEGISRPEFEYEIPVAEAREMMKLAVWPVIDKIRHIIYVLGKKWEVDVFTGANAGLIIAEVELTNAEEVVHLPGWVAEEVSGDQRFHNSCLAQNPYCNWKGRV